MLGDVIPVVEFWDRHIDYFCGAGAAGSGSTSDPCFSICENHFRAVERLCVGVAMDE